MGEVYAAVTDRILINLAKYFPYIAEGMTPGESWKWQVRKLAEIGQVTRETEAIILESMKGGDKALADLLEEVIRETIHDVPTICDLLKKCGFKLLRCADRMLDDGGHGTTWFLICQK